MDLPPGLLREAADENIAGGEAMTVRARQVWAERLDPVDDVRPLWICVAEFADQTCEELCDGRFIWRRRLEWTGSLTVTSLLAEPALDWFPA